MRAEQRALLYENTRQALEPQLGPPGFKNERSSEHLDMMLELNEMICSSLEDVADRRADLTYADIVTETPLNLTVDPGRSS